MAFHRTWRTLLAVAAIAAAGGAWASGEPHRFVRIGAGGLQPEEIRIRSDEMIGWVNHSSRLAQVSFAAETARHMVCSHEGSFRIDGDALVSPRIRAEQFASLCHLKPGRYAYRVELTSGAGGDAAFSRLRLLEGVVVVE